MKRWTVALLFWLLCGPASAIPESIEGFSYGSSADEIVLRIGEPSSVEGPEYHKPGRVWIWTWDYYRYGALFEVEAETQDGPKSVRSLTIVAPSAWRTSSGLRVGEKAERILELYPKVQQVSETLWFVRSSDRRKVTGFELAGSKIKSIFLGSTAP